MGLSYNTNLLFACDAAGCAAVKLVPDESGPTVPDDWQQLRHTAGTPSIIICPIHAVKLKAIKGLSVNG